MTRIYSLLLSALLLFTIGGLSAYAADCPAGTKKETVTKKGGSRIVSCIDGAGLKQGPETHWLANGKKMSEGEWRDGKEHGAWILYWRNEKKREKAQYRKGRKHGPETLWHQNGKIAGEVKYFDGKKHGKSVEFWGGGKKRSDGSYYDGKKIGTWYEWDWQGKLIKMETCTAGYCRTTK